MSLDWADLEDRLHLADPGRAVGRVANLVGMIVEVADLGAPVGSLCRIETGRQGAPVLCEVVGFRDDRLLVMPYQEARGIAPGFQRPRHEAPAEELHTVRAGGLRAREFQHGPGLGQRAVIVAGGERGSSLLQQRCGRSGWHGARPRRSS